MNINELEISQAMIVEMLLEKKIEDFFGDSENEVIIFQASIYKQNSKRSQIETMEALIPLIRGNIAIGHIKQALKLMVALESMMNKLKY